MPDDLQKRQANQTAIEDRLNNEVVEARLKYNQAKWEFEEATRRAQSLGLDTLDGAHALRLAARREKDATLAYGNAIGRLCDFMLRGTVPEGY